MSLADFDEDRDHRERQPFETRVDLCDVYFIGFCTYENCNRTNDMICTIKTYKQGFLFTKTFLFLSHRQIEQVSYRA